MIKGEYVVYGCNLLLLGFLLWKEARRINRAHISWRMLATVFAMIALACMALPLHYSKTERQPVSGGSVLLTEGFNSDSVSDFLKIHNNIPVYTLDETLLAAKKYNAILVGDATALPIGGLHIFGYGLNNHSLEELPSQPLFFHPSAPAGFTAINWNQRIHSGEKLVLQGNFINTYSSAQKLVLSGFNTTLDSVMVNANSKKQFTLTTTPKQVDRAVYFLAAINKKDTTEKQPIAIQVQQTEPLGILLLAASPDFENKFLRNWLAEKGYPVLVRTAISKNKFSKEYLNMPALNADRITPALLDKFDIIIADALELASISKGELGIIQSYVMQKKKGLIIKADSARSSFYTPLFPLVRTDSGMHEVKLSLADTSVKLQPLTIDHTHLIRIQNGTRALLRDRQNRFFAGTALYGSGKIVLSTLSNTFNWALAGHTDSYQAVWSEILNTAAAKDPYNETWHKQPMLSRVNEPATISVYTNSNTIPQAEIEGASVYLSGHYDLPYIWTGSFWPKKAGWQSGIQLDGQPWYWYAYEKNDWKYVIAGQNIAATQHYQQKNQQQHQTTEQRPQIQKHLINKLWFFLLFLLCAGYLWFENKYYNR